MGSTKAALAAPALFLLACAATAARRLAALHLAPLLAARTALAWARAALAAACCRLTVSKADCPALVCIYSRCVGGYHSDLQQAWRALEAAAAAAEPDTTWRHLARFTLLFDDQINYPAEQCRAALGFVVGLGGDDPEREAAAWRAHPLLPRLGLAVGVLPAGACLAAADLPCCGPLAYLIALLRALDALRGEVRASGLRAKVPGLLELHSPASRTISFLLPLEPRTDLLPF